MNGPIVLYCCREFAGPKYPSPRSSKFLVSALLDLSGRPSFTIVASKVNPDNVPTTAFTIVIKNENIIT